MTISPGCARAIVDNFERLAKSADDQARASQLEAQRWRDAAAEARQKFGLVR